MDWSVNGKEFCHPWMAFIYSTCMEDWIFKGFQYQMDAWKRWNLVHCNSNVLKLLKGRSSRVPCAIQTPERGTLCAFVVGWVANAMHGCLSSSDESGHGVWGDQVSSWFPCPERTQREEGRNESRMNLPRSNVLTSKGTSHWNEHQREACLSVPSDSLKSLRCLSL